MTRHAPLTTLFATLVLGLFAVTSAQAVDLLTFSRLNADGSSGEPIPVMFNPTELSVKKTVPWEEQRRGPSLPKLPTPRTVKTDLLYDTAPTGGHVDHALLPLLDLAEDDPLLGQPPLVRLTWGSGLRLTGRIEEIDVKYEQFLPDGVPVRATVSLTLRERLPGPGPGIRH